MGQKALNLAVIKKEDAKQFGTRRQIQVNGYTLEIDKKFRQTKITSLLREVLEKVDYCRANGIDLQKFDLSVYSMLLLLKYFTSLDIPDKFEDQLSILDKILDGDWLVPIISEFDVSEMDKIKDYIESFSKNTDEFIKTIGALDLENKDILTIKDGE